MKRRLRFSLQTLLLSVLLIGSAAALWLHWEPWVLQARISRKYSLNYAYFTADERRIVSGINDILFTNDSFSGDEVDGGSRSFFSEHNGMFAGRPIALSPFNGNTLHVYDLETAQETSLTGCTSAIKTLALSPDGTRIAAGCDDGSIHFWNERGQHVGAFTPRHAEIRSIALSCGGKRIAVSFWDIGAGAWDCESGQPLIPYLEKMSSFVDISADGSRALFFCWMAPNAKQEPTESYHLWDLDRAKALCVLAADSDPHQIFDPYRSAHFSPNGKRLLSRHIHAQPLIDAESGQVAADFKPPILALTFAQSSDMFAMSNDFGTALYDSRTGALLATLPEKVRVIDDLWRREDQRGSNEDEPPPFQPPSPQFSADGSRLLAMTSEGDLDVWFRRRPERWWGLAWLPEFWVTLVLAVLLAANTIRNWRRAN